jgi:hypothetical protein
MAKLHAWQMQVAAILCNMLLCALPNNDVSFAELLISNQGFQIAKFCSFLNYFRRISQVRLLLHSLLHTLLRATILLVPLNYLRRMPLGTLSMSTYSQVLF